MSTTEERTEFLTIYLQDHAAAATAGSRRAERLAEAEAESKEAMQMAVRAKRSLWETLRVVLPPSTPVDLDALIVRADDQLDLLSRLHAGRVDNTFCAPTALTERSA